MYTPKTKPRLKSSPLLNWSTAVFVLRSEQLMQIHFTGKCILLLFYKSIRFNIPRF